MKTPPDFKMRLSDDQRRKVAMLAAREKITPQEWLDKTATLVTRTILNEGGDLDPKTAGTELGVSKFTVIRYFNQRLFPNAYMLNGRVIRIPRGDVEKLKKSRKLIIK